MQKPSIIFVDGPNGVGKDYFIDGLEQTFKEHHTGVNVTKLHASTLVDYKKNLSDERIFTEYNTPEDRRERIGKGHVGVLRAAKKIANQYSEPSNPAVVIVNRYITSWLCYNLFPDLDRAVVTNDTEEVKKLETDKQQILSYYVDELAEIINSREMSVAVVRLDIFDKLNNPLLVKHAVEMTRTRLETREKTRKPFDTVWSEKLHDYYRSTDDLLSRALSNASNYRLTEGSQNHHESVYLKHMTVRDSSGYNSLYRDIVNGAYI